MWHRRSLPARYPQAFADECDKLRTPPSWRSEKLSREDQRTEPVLAPHLPMAYSESGFCCGTCVLGRTFKDLYAEIDPTRRASLVFGMTRMHRRYLESVGGQTSVVFDPSEYLSDEPTIAAYLQLVRGLNDPAQYLSARADAIRARRRLSQEPLPSRGHPHEGRPNKLRWASGDLLGRTFHSPLLDVPLPAKPQAIEDLAGPRDSAKDWHGDQQVEPASGDVPSPKT